MIWLFEFQLSQLINAAYRTYAHCTWLMGAFIFRSSSLQKIWFFHILLDILTWRHFWKLLKLPSYIGTYCWRISKHILLLWFIFGKPIEHYYGSQLTKFLSHFQGPIFAVIGAWLIYQLRNKDVTPKELSDSMFYKAIIATALSFLLGNFGPMDNW